MRQVLHARLQPRAGYGFRRSAHAATASGGPALSQDTQLIADVSYGSFRREHAPYKYQKHTVYVSGKAARLGQEALWYYQSQDGNHQQANIIDYDKLPREALPAFPYSRLAGSRRLERTAVADFSAVIASYSEPAHAAVCLIFALDLV